MISSILSFSKNKKITILMMTDFLLCLSSFLFAFYLRLDNFLINESLNQFLSFLFCIIAFFTISFSLDLYKPLSRFFHLDNFLNILKIFIIYTVITFIFFLFFRIEGVPRTVGLIYPVLFFITLLTSRYFINFLVIFIKKNKKNTLKAIFYGDVEVTSSIYHLFKGYKTVAFLTNDKNVSKSTINSIPIYSIDNLDSKFKNKIDTILAIGDQNFLKTRHKIESFFLDKKVVFKVIPDVKDILEYQLKNDVQNFNLVNEKIQWNDKTVREDYKNSVILVTGGGGSIGRELVLQLAQLNPKKLLILDNSEFNLYQIIEELSILIKEKDILTEIIPLLVSVQDFQSIENTLKFHKPNFIFHCAAYKHVNIVQNNIVESVKNNFFTTYNLCELCEKYSIKNFILISSDKAVNPSNIMGCTKRLSELAVQHFSKKSNSENKFLSVRFANVLNSSGSVIPLFVKQIKNGGPITLTHKEVSRYFMRIVDAVKLVIQSPLVGKNGEILLLKMGEPIKIYDLAVKLIQYYGLTEKNDENPFGDIKIVVTGLKVGEKMNEDLYFDPISKLTKNKDIISVDNLNYNPKKFEDTYNNLKLLVKNDDSLEINNLFKDKKLFS
jgi:FlaA1/EpsC-like NDP-sugar epimerase